MASSATQVLELCITLLLLMGQCLSIAFQPQVESAVGGEQGLLILGNDERNGVLRESFFGEELLKLLDEGFVLTQACYDIIPCLVSHLHGVHRRTCGLLLQVGSTTIPELLEVEVRIVNGRCIHTAELSVDTLGGAVVRTAHTALVEDMAGGAGDGAVQRDTRVVVHTLA